MKKDKEEQELADKLSELYEKATTKEEYEKVVKEGGEIKVVIGEDPDMKVSTRLSSWWAEYYLHLKFPTSSADEDRHDFAFKIESIYTYLTDPDNKVALLYLESVIWSNLLDDQKQAGQLIDKMNRIISSEKVSLASILRHINSRGLKKMAEKNWLEAVEIFSEIGKLSHTELQRPENLRHTGNIINNMGTSKIRSGFDVTGGINDLFEAKSFYLREDQPSQKHLEGLRNRLGEATKKLEERMK
ncbi:hypothetical protein KAT63_00885 [Candidatus Parcubacteria bacterium]|nr:hypothetical protein [Candidatus Parcubacteria bacterium]